MQNRHDNNVRSKLESMNAVPTAFNFNAAATWQKMEEQLQPTKKKKRITWAYWAAACLPLAVGTMILGTRSKTLNNNSPQASVHHETIKPITVATVHANTAIFQQDKTSAEKIQKETIVLKRLEIKPTPNTTRAQEAFIVDTASRGQVVILQESMNSIPSNAMSIATTSVKPLATAIKKPRLKVIHINELDAPPPPIIAKLDNKKQQQEQSLNDAPDNEPSRPFWQKKIKPVTAASAFIDNQ